jgi:lipopolysaccharide export system permease protein
MKIIHRSILKELILTFLLSLACLNFILMMEKLLRLSRFLSGVGTSALDMTKLIVLLQPSLFLLTIPMAMLLSTLLIYGRLNVDSELVILKSSGMHFRGIALPVIALGLACFLFNAAVSFSIGPMSSMKLREEITNVMRMRAPFAIEAGRFTTTFKDTLILIREKASENTMRGIFIYDDRNRSEPRVMFAKEGNISTTDGTNINLLLKDGYINIAKGDITTEIAFKKYNMLLKLESDAPGRKNAELTPFELYEKIQNSDRRHALVLSTELYRRITLPLLCIILMFFGPPLSMIAGKSGRLGGLTLGLAVFMIYYMILLYCENLVRADRILPSIGAWLPTLIIGLVAVVLFRRESLR